jgi:hypothetical protein
MGVQETVKEYKTRAPFLQTTVLGSCQERPGILFGPPLNMTGHAAQMVMHGELTRCYVYGLGKYGANSQ